MSTTITQWRIQLVPQRCVFAGPTEWLPSFSVTRTVQGYARTMHWELRWLKWRVFVHRVRYGNMHLTRQEAHHMHVNLITKPS